MQGKAFPPGDYLIQSVGSEGYVTVADTNKKNLISALLFRARRFPLLSGNEVTQTASWPLADAGRTARVEPENGGRTVAVGTRYFALFSFPSKRISLRRTTDAFSRPAASSRLLFPSLCLSFAMVPPFPVSILRLSLYRVLRPLLSLWYQT